MQARNETEEAIQAGNHRFNAMLHERMSAEERLNAQIGSLKLEVAAKEQNAAALREARDASVADGQRALQRAEAAWEEQERALRAQHDQAQSSWQSKAASAAQQAGREREAVKAAQRESGALEAQLSAAQKQLEQSMGECERLSEQLTFSQRDAQLAGDAAQDTASQQASALVTVRVELEAAQRGAVRAQTQLEEARAVAIGDAASLEARVRAAEALAQLQRTDKDEAQAQAAQLQCEIDQLHLNAEVLRKERDELQNMLETTSSVQVAATAESAEQRQALQAQLQQAERQVDDLEQRMRAAVCESQADGSKALAAQRDAAESELAAAAAEHAKQLHSAHQQHAQDLSNERDAAASAMEQAQARFEQVCPGLSVCLL